MVATKIWTGAIACASPVFWTEEIEAIFGQTRCKTAALQHCRSQEGRSGMHRVGERPWTPKYKCGAQLLPQECYINPDPCYFQKVRRYSFHLYRYVLQKYALLLLEEVYIRYNIPPVYVAYSAISLPSLSYHNIYQDQVVLEHSQQPVCSHSSLRPEVLD